MIYSIGFITRVFHIHYFRLSDKELNFEYSLTEFTIICIFGNKKLFLFIQIHAVCQNLYKIMQVQFYILMIIMLLNNDLNWSSHSMKLVYILPSNIMAPEE